MSPFSYDIKGFEFMKNSSKTSNGLPQNKMRNMKGDEKMEKKDMVKDAYKKYEKKNMSKNSYDKAGY